MNGIRVATTFLALALVVGTLLAGCDSGEVREQVRDAAQGAADEAKATAGAHIDQAVDAKSTELSVTAAAKGEELKATLVAKGGEMGETAEAVGSELGGTLESRGSDFGGTLEAKGGELQPTLKAAATLADQTIREFRETADELDGWAAGVAAALGAIGEQSAELDADRTLIGADRWRSDTEEAVADLAGLARRAAEVADDLERRDAQPHVRDTLTELSGELDDLVVGMREALADDDAEAFVDETRRLADLAATVDALTRLLDKLRPAE